DAELAECGCGSGVVAGVDRQAELDIRVDGVESLVLKTVRADLVEEPDPPPLVVEVQKDAAVGGADHREGGAELIPAVAAERAQYVAGETFGVKADEDGLRAVELTTRERDDLRAVEPEHADAEVA